MKNNLNPYLKPTVALMLLFLLFFPPVSGQLKFKDVTKKAHLTEPLKGMMGHGAAWGDIDGNGYPDLFFGTFSGRPDSIYAKRGHAPKSEPDKLFLNNGNGTFTEVKNTPINKRGRNSGSAFADFDNDGDLDLVVSHNSYDGEKEQFKTGNFLFENDGSGNFTDVTAKSGLDFGWPFTGRNTFVFDYNGDGLLDIFMQEDNLREDASGGYSRLMKNKGNLVFEDVTKEAGFPIGYRTGLYGIGGWVGDINGDHWPDVFFAHSCRMFLNNRDGSFHEKDYHMVPSDYTKGAIISKSMWTCGADLGDLDNDGDMDMVMGNHFPSSDTIIRTLYVYLNEGNDSQGDPILRNITIEAGLPAPTSKSPHIQLQDMDNDGWVDIIASSCKSFIYRNKGLEGKIPEFEKPISSGIEGGISYWAAGPLADYNRDGKLDFIGPEWEPAVASPLLKNVTIGGAYLDVKLELNNEPNRNGVDAKVDIYKEGMLGNPEGRIASRIITVSNGYSCGYEAIAHFGLNKKNKTVDIRVIMPCDGKVYTATSVEINQLYIIR